MPRLIGEVIAFIMSNIGPKGINFARYSIDYHLLRNYLHVLDAWGDKRANASLPKYATEIVEKYLSTDDKLVELKETIRSKQ